MKEVTANKWAIPRGLCRRADLSLRSVADRQGATKTFGAEFDPQPFHLDEDAARDTIFGGLAASGWHTAAITMRLLVDSDLKPAGGIVGAGADEFRWPRPVRPGDELRAESEVLEVRPSRSRPDQGSIKVRTTTLNQNDEAVQVIIANLVVPRRPPQDGKERQATKPEAAVIESCPWRVAMRP